MKTKEWRKSKGYRHFKLEFDLTEEEYSILREKYHALDVVELWYMYGREGIDKTILKIKAEKERTEVL